MVTDINNMGDKKVRKKFSLLLIVVLGFMMVSCSTFPQRKKEAKSSYKFVKFYEVGPND